MGDAVVYLFSDAGDYVNGTILVGKWVCVLGTFFCANSLRFAVDGGAWRTSGGGGSGFAYPKSVTSDEPFAERLRRTKL